MILFMKIIRLNKLIKFKKNKINKNKFKKQKKII